MPEVRFAEYLRQLGIEGARERTLGAYAPALRPDFVAEHDGKLWIIELKARKAGMDAVSQLALYRDYYQHQFELKSTIHVVLIAPSVDPVAREALETIGGRFLRGKAPGTDREGAVPDTKMTTPKAWRVCFQLLRGRAENVKTLASECGVSYGWTHRVVDYLATRRIVEKDGLTVRLKDHDRLLDLAAWERPFERLPKRRIQIAASDAWLAAREIQDYLAAEGATFAFTGYVGAQAYGSSLRKNDRVEVYLSERIDLSVLEAQGKDAVTLFILDPGKQALGHRHEKALRVAPPEMVARDLASIGLGARGALMEMVNAMAA